MEYSRLLAIPVEEECTVTNQVNTEEEEELIILNDPSGLSDHDYTPNRPRYDPNYVPKKKVLKNRTHLLEPEPDLPMDLLAAWRIVQYFLSSSCRSFCAPFSEKPDTTLKEYKNYERIISRPIWLSIIKFTLSSGGYSSITEVVRDLRRMIENCYRYFGSNHPNSKKAMRIETILEQKLALLPRELREKTALELTAVKEEPPVVTITDSGRRCRQAAVAAMAATSSNATSSNANAGVVADTALLSLVKRERMQRARDERMKQREEKRLERGQLQSVADAWDITDLLPRVKEEVQTMWELIHVAQFFKLCQPSLNTPREFTMYELERAILLPQESKLLATLVTALLLAPHMKATMATKPPLSYATWNERVRKKTYLWYKTLRYEGIHKVMEEYGVDERFFRICDNDPLAKGREFHSLTLEQRAALLHALCDCRVAKHKSAYDCLTECDDSLLRESVLGQDNEGVTYVYFPILCDTDVRVYAQSALPQNPYRVIRHRIARPKPPKQRKSRKHSKSSRNKKRSKQRKKNGKKKRKRHHHRSSSSASSSKSSSPSSQESSDADSFFDSSSDTDYDDIFEVVDPHPNPALPLFGLPSNPFALKDDDQTNQNSESAAQVKKEICDDDDEENSQEGEKSPEEGKTIETNGDASSGAASEPKNESQCSTETPQNGDVDVDTETHKQEVKPEAKSDEVGDVAAATTTTTTTDDVSKNEPPADTTVSKPDSVKYTDELGIRFEVVADSILSLRALIASLTPPEIKEEQKEEVQAEKETKPEPAEDNTTVKEEPKKEEEQEQSASSEAAPEVEPETNKIRTRGVVLSFKEALSDEEDDDEEDEVMRRSIRLRQRPPTTLAIKPDPEQIQPTKIAEPKTKKPTKQMRLVRNLTELLEMLAPNETKWNQQESAVRLKLRNEWYAFHQRQQQALIDQQRVQEMYHLRQQIQLQTAAAENKFTAAGLAAASLDSMGENPPSSVASMEEDEEDDFGEGEKFSGEGESRSQEFTKDDTNTNDTDAFTTRSQESVVDENGVSDEGEDNLSEGEEDDEVVVDGGEEETFEGGDDEEYMEVNCSEEMSLLQPVPEYEPPRQPARSKPKPKQQRSKQQPQHCKDRDNFLEAPSWRYKNDMIYEDDEEYKKIFEDSDDDGGGGDSDWDYDEERTAGRSKRRAAAAAANKRKRVSEAPRKKNDHDDDPDFQMYLYDRKYTPRRPQAPQPPPNIVRNSVAARKEVVVITKHQQQQQANNSTIAAATTSTSVLTPKIIRTQQIVGQITPQNLPMNKTTPRLLRQVLPTGAKTIQIAPMGGMNRIALPKVVKTTAGGGATNAVMPSSPQVISFNPNSQVVTFSDGVYRVVSRSSVQIVGGGGQQQQQQQQHIVFTTAAPAATPVQVAPPQLLRREPTLTAHVGDDGVEDIAPPTSHFECGEDNAAACLVFGGGNEERESGVVIGEAAAALPPPTDNVVVQEAFPEATGYIPSGSLWSDLDV